MEIFNVFKRVASLLLLLCSLLGVQAQTAVPYEQKFSSKTPQGWSIVPAYSVTSPSWKTDTGVVVSAKYAMHCAVPLFSGDTAELVTPFFDCTKYAFVQLRFFHICKLVASDVCEIQYQEQGIGSNYAWKTIPYDAYRGSSTAYKADKAFSHASYSDWQPNDTFAKPDNTWWKEEIFNLENYAGFSTVRFRFIIRRGPDANAFGAAGWYIDDFRVLGSSAAMEPPMVAFTSHLTDTVIGPGPYTVTAKVATRSTVGIVNPWLAYTITYGGASRTDSVKMTSIKGDSLWQGIIPQQYYGTMVSYSILGRDSAGNSKKISDAFVTKRLKMGKLIGYTYYEAADTSTSSSTNNLAIIYHVGYATSHTRSLYLASEINPQKISMVFSKLAWYLRPNSTNAGGVTVTRNLKIYMLATDDQTVSATAVDPVAAGATLVFDGSTVSKTEWNEVSFSRPFPLPAGKNLLIFYEGVGGTTSSTSIYWAGHTSSATRCTYNYSGSWTGTAMVPIIRLGLSGAAPVDSSSVALASIDNPTEGTLAGVQPVKVTIQNVGDGYLKSCDVNWAVNGVLQTPKAWKGNLYCDFYDTLTLGSYTQKAMGYDTITVWVSNPNNVQDSVTDDDTLTVIPFGCTGAFAGTYTVGRNDATHQYNFPDLASAIKLLKLCGTKGDVTLQVASGVYTDKLSINGLNFAHRLEITSLAGHADSVVFRPKTGPVVSLNNCSGLTFSKITFDARKARTPFYCVQMTNGLNDIEFSHCTLYGFDTTVSSNLYTVIYRPSGSPIHNIRFIGNEILGGSYGVYFYGSGTNARNSNIVFDSNHIANYLSYVGYFYYNNNLKFTHNRIDRARSGFGYNYGMLVYYSDSSLFDANKFHIYNNNVTQYAFRSNYTDSLTIISNNEVVMRNDTSYSSPTTYGMYVYYTYGTKVYNNSVLVYGKAAGNRYGLYVYGGGAAYTAELKNNIVVCNGTGTVYPLYLTSSSYVTNFDVDYNCWWSPKNVGYVGAAKTTLAAFQSSLKTAVHDLYMHPVFADTTVSLLPGNFSKLDCPNNPAVRYDIAGILRVGQGVRGCYTDASSLVQANGMLTDMINLPTTVAVGDTLCPSVVLMNGGLDNIKEASIRWALNGVAQGQDLSWKGNLAIGESDTISLGCFIAKTSGALDITAWLTGIGSLNDLIASDDTTGVSLYVCQSKLAGNYTIGPNGDFPTLNKALSIIDQCGMSGDVYFQLPTGVYTEALTINNCHIDAPFHLYVTSLAGHADSVVFRPKSGPVLSLSNSSGIVFRNITFDAEKLRTYCIQMTTGLDDIEFSHCKMIGSDTNVASNLYATVYRASGTPVVTNIRFIGNEILGGSYGVYFYGSSSTVMNNHIVFDSNHIANYYYYGGYLYYNNNLKFTHNRSDGARSGYNYDYGCILYYNDTSLIDANIFRTYDRNTYVYGLRVGYSKPATIVSNNDIVLHNNKTTSYGLSVYYEQGAKIINNSVLVYGSATTQYGIYNYCGGTSYSAEIKNNLAVCNGTGTAYPYYLNSANYVSGFDVDYNCWWSPKNVGYVGAAKTTLAAFQTSHPTAVHDMFARPEFKDSSVSLKLAAPTLFDCPRHSSVNQDLLGVHRDTVTTRGAYTKVVTKANGALTDLLDLPKVTEIKDTVYPRVVLLNSGIDTLTEATIRITVNGVVYGNDIAWKGSLASTETDTISLGMMRFNAGTNVISVYLTGIGKLTDGFSGDDTVSLEIFTCTASYAGTYTVGANGHFKTMGEALDSLYLCGIGAPVTLSILPDTLMYGNVVIKPIPGASATNTLTITSSTGNYADVLWYRSDDPQQTTVTTEAAPIVLDGASHVIVKNITLSGHSVIQAAYSSSHAIVITGSSHDVEVSNCHLFVPRNFTSRITSHNHSAVYIYTGGVRNVHVHNCLIEGGATGCYVYGSSSTSRLSNVTIENNEIGYIDYSALYAYYADSLTFRNNTAMQRRISLAPANANMVYALYTNANIENNTFDFDGIIYGMYFGYFGNPAKGFYRVANNEVRGILTSATGYGVYVTGDTANRVYLDFSHNSLSYDATGSTAYGFYCGSANLKHVIMKNNIFNMQCASAGTVYPIYISSAAYVTYFDINNNCIYNAHSSKYVGYTGGVRSTMAAWKAAVTTDTGSVFMRPLFANESRSLALLDSTGLSCPALAAHPTDIVGVQRGQTTTMGAYHFAPQRLDISLTGVQPNVSGSLNTNIPLVLRFKNTGTDTLKKAQIGYTLNGQSGTAYAWSGNLPYLDTTSVTVGTIQLKKGFNSLTIYSYDPNGAADQRPFTDTLTVSVYGCDSALSGSYSVGTANSFFPTLEEAIATAKYCGLNGHVVFNVAAGKYNALVMDNFNPGGKQNTLTIRSADRDRNRVTIAGTNALALDAVSNVIFEDITFNGSVIAVNMRGTIENVEIRHCNLFGPEGVTNSSYRAVNYEGVSSSGKMLKDVRFIGNDVRGGYYTFYLPYFGSASGVMQSSSVTIDSNTIRGGYYYAIHTSSYGQFESISHNVITNGSNASTFYGIYLSSYINARRIEGNLIHLNSSSTSYGIYATSYNNNVSYSSGPGLIANNEIIVTGSSTKYGIYMSYYSRYNVVNNSIYVKGTSTSYAMYRSTSSNSYSGHPINVFNNQLINDYSSGYAFYWADTATTAYGTRDYNNYYSRSGNLTYLRSSAQTTLAAIKSRYSNQDQHSMNTQPVWVHTNMSDLRLKNARVFQCPISYNVTENILGEPRVTPTVIGCYGIEPDSVDAGLVTFVGADAATSVGTHPIRVVVVNSGLKPIDSLTVQFSINGVAQTPVQYKPALPLAFRQTDTVNLGSFSFQTGSCTMKAFVQLAKDTNRTNDTITLTRNICTSVFAGVVTIGKTGDYDMSNLSKLVSDMANCGVAGDVILQVESGNYTVSTMDLSIFSSIMNGYRLTITSKAGNRDSVTITASSGNLYTLKGNSKITFRDLTLEAKAGHVIQFQGAADDIEILHNHLKCPTTGSSSYAPVYKASATDFIHGLRIVGNKIEGGYYGVYLYAGTSTTAYGTGITVDSNEVYGQYYYALFLYYGEFNSVSHNVMYPRTSGSSTTWYGLRLYYDNAKEVLCNYVDATKGSGVTGPYGVYMYYLNANGTNTQALFANNVVKVDQTSSNQGVYMFYSRVKFYHNSIRVTGTGQGRALYYSSTTTYPVEIIGNQFITDANQFPVYAGTTTVGVAKLDYNNYYGGGTMIGYYGGNQTSLSAWQSATGQDAHSVSSPVTFVDEKNSLKLTNYVDFLMPRLQEVAYDVENAPRTSMTAMGAYTPQFDSLDAALTDFANTDLSNAAQISVQVTLLNMGGNTLKSASIHWTIDGVAQTPFAWTGSLPMLQSQVVTLGAAKVTPSAYHSIVAWVSNPNNGKDGNVLNDTISMREYVCNGPLAGTYTVGGSNPDFNDLQEAVDALLACGVNAPVVLSSRTATYGKVSVDGAIQGASATNTITVMPEKNAKVAISEKGGTALTLRNTGFWNFRDITIGNTTDGVIGVSLGGNLKDVSFRNCDICASTSTSTSTYYAVEYRSASGSQVYPVNVSFIGNRIRGGYYNMYLYYLGGSAAEVPLSSMTVDSNVFEGAYYYGFYSYMAHFKSVSYNQVTNRPNSSSTFYAMYFSNYTVTERLTGNRVHVNNSSTAYGIYLTTYQNYASYGGSRGLLNNNEVIVEGSGGVKYGIYLTNPYQVWDVDHNSVFVRSSGSTVYGLYANNTNTSGKINLHNNLAVARSTSTTYAVYLGGSGYATSTYGERDYNNYVVLGGTSFAYADGAAVSNLAALQNLSGMDKNSVSVQPSFVDSTVDLRLNDYIPFLCPLRSTTPVDINSQSRSKLTTMGCYSERFFEGMNLEVVEFTSPQPVKDVICYADSTPVTVVIQNQGLKDADFTKSPLKVSVDVSGAINYHYDTTFTTGKMGFKDADTLQLVTIPTIADGIYNIKVTLNDTADAVLEDDTLSVVYRASRVSLPYDVDFTTEPNEFINNTIAGNTEWRVQQGAGNSPAIAPAFGTGRLEFIGSGEPGAYSADAIFNSVNVHSCVNPTLSFWFAHNKDCEGPDMMVLSATTDGGATYKELIRVLVKDTATAWKQYTVDLSDFTQSSCLSLVFRAMGFGNTNQSIDRIRITAERDAEIRLLPLAQQTACDNTPKEIKAVIVNNTRMAVDLTGDTVRLNVTGAVNYSSLYVCNHKLDAYATDTITLGQCSLAANGHYYIEAFMQSRDDHASNDTLRDSTLYIWQEVALDSLTGIDEQMEKMMGETVSVTAHVSNKGNIPVDRLFIRMKLDANEIVTDTVYKHLEAGDTLCHAMSKPYTVPFVSKLQPFYVLEVEVELACDADYTNDSITIVGKVNIPDSMDIQVLDITTTSPATGKVKLNPTVRIANIGNMDATSIMVHVDVIDTSNTVVESISDVVNSLSANETKDVTFTMSYKVPDYNGKYTLKAYVEAVDGDTIQQNDTLAKVFDCTKDSTAIRDAQRLDWSMGQNIPNPSANVTRIPYNVPQAGVIVFSVMSANGQLLHREEIQAEAGNGRVELQVSSYANGIYYYSMEYQGQRIVRKMSVTR